jgi:TAT (twin-arginine translocation) pathway signal sequence.
MTTTLNRRQFMKLMAAAAAAGSVPAMYSARAFFFSQSATRWIL